MVVNYRFDDAVTVTNFTVRPGSSCAGAQRFFLLDSQLRDGSQLTYTGSCRPACPGGWQQRSGSPLEGDGLLGDGVVVDARQNGDFRIQVLSQPLPAWLGSVHHRVLCANQDAGFYGFGQLELL